jgi:hypothetical protein
MYLVLGAAAKRGCASWYTSPVGPPVKKATQSPISGYSVCLVLREQRVIVDVQLDAIARATETRERASICPPRCSQLRDCRCILQVRDLHSLFRGRRRLPAKLASLQRLHAQQLAPECDSKGHDSQPRAVGAATKLFLPVGAVLPAPSGAEEAVAAPSCAIRALLTLGLCLL